ncbi:hypothetical protein Pelo_15045 [Pelomyxa schiedti]|nr:hypothetical protein Pelo_15045 [Pelomyxa schiedti]
MRRAEVALRVSLSSHQAAREQLLALAMSSHPRCGGRSPARAFMSLPPVATAPLWEWCLRGSEVVLGLCAWVPRCRPNSVCYFTVGVSAALLGVTRDLRPTYVGNFDATLVTRLVPIDPGRVVVTEPRLSLLRMLLVVLGRKPVELATAPRAQQFCAHYGNERWWVHCDYTYLTIANLVIRGSNPTITKVVCRDAFPKTEPPMVCTSIFLSNRTNLDEAVLVLFDSYRRNHFLLVIDLKQTYTTGAVTVLSLTKCFGPPGLFSGSLSMIKSTGQRALFVRTRVTECESVWEAEESSGTMTPISSDISGLSQLSHYLFCISKKDGSAEVWDCNNTAAPLRVIPAKPNSSLAVMGMFPSLVLRKFQGKTTIEIEEDSGCQVATVSLPREFSNFDFTVTSFL